MMDLARLVTKVGLAELLTTVSPFLRMNSSMISSLWLLFIQLHRSEWAFMSAQMITTLMRLFRWTLFRALFQPEFRHFRSFFSIDDLVWSIIFNLSDYVAS